jgi:nonribosomal peptide synthetase DhbF
VECKLCTISDVIDEQGIQRIDYLKVDTEGAELNVLKGIRSDHWPIIRQAVIEVHDGSSGLQNVIEILDRNGFHSVVEQPRKTLSHLRMVYAVKQCSSSLLTVETSFPSQIKTLS